MGLYENPPYYISAYGLAVKHGFLGTEKEWLESLKGEKVLLRYQEEKLQWKLEDSEEWQDLMTAEDIRGDAFEEALEQANSAKEAAAGSAEQAGKSATAAEGSAERAEGAANTAAQDAVNAAAKRLSGYVTDAQDARSGAEAAESAAEGAAQRAAQETVNDAKELLAGYVGDAQTARGGAETAAAAARADREAAERSAADAEAAKDGAQESQTAAKDSADKAAKDRAGALESANAAKNAETEAKDAKAAADASADRAEKAAREAEEIAGGDYATHTDLREAVEGLEGELETKVETSTYTAGMAAKQDELTGKQGQIVGFDAEGHAAAVDDRTPDVLDAAFELMLDGKNTTKVFNAWWPLSEGAGQSKYQRLCRFAEMAARAWDGKVYTVQGYAAGKSTDSTMTALDDLAALGKAALATDKEPGGADWAEEDPMTWYVRGNALSLKDGTMNILALEGEEGFDLTGESAPVYTFALALWWKETRDEEHITKSWRTTQADGFRPHPGDVAPDGTKRPITWHPTFGGGLTNDGTKLTSGAGRTAAVYISTLDGLTMARAMSPYEGLWCDCDTDWLLGMWQLRHQDKENSNILEGCDQYNYQYKVAVEEENVTRVLVTTEQAEGFVAGSCVIVGEPGPSDNKDRGQAQMRSIADRVKIASIETVSVRDAQYGALNLDLGGKTITTTENTYVSTIAWDRGTTEAVPGHKDGCITDLKNGKYPIRVAGVEVMEGAYATGLDPLYNVTTGGTKDKFNYAVHQCRDSEKLAGSIGDGYEDTKITFENMPKGWNYPKEFKQNDKGIVFPESLDGSSAGYYKSGFYGSDAVRVAGPLRFGDLRDGGNAGLACEHGNFAPSWSHWYYGPRLSGAGKKRGEWRA